MQFLKGIRQTALAAAVAMAGSASVAEPFFPPFPGGNGPFQGGGPFGGGGPGFGPGAGPVAGPGAGPGPLPLLGLIAGAVAIGQAAQTPPQAQHEPVVINNYYGETAGTAGYEPWTSAWYQYCANRYRSFDARTGTFTGNDGRAHFCTGS